MHVSGFFFFVSPQRISFLFGNPLLISYQVVRVYFIYFVHVTFCRHFAGRSESYRAQTNNNNGIMLLIFIKMPIFCIPSFVGLLPWPGGIRMYGIYQSGVFSGYFTILLVQIQYSVCVYLFHLRTAGQCQLHYTQFRPNHIFTFFVVVALMLVIVHRQFRFKNFVVVNRLLVYSTI